MGASGSKAAQTGARKFPTRAPGAAPPRAPRPPRPAPEPPRQPPAAAFSENPAQRADAPNQETVATEFMSPGFAARLRELGAVQPNPLFSNSSVAGPRGPSPSSSSSQDASTQYDSPPPPPSWPSARDNATLGVLEARTRLEEQAEREADSMGRASDKGRELVDVGTIRRVLLLRARGIGEGEIEQRFGLRSGVVRRLGPKGVVEATTQLSE
ncbi:hypothetical protein GE09DRAFT_1214455 [Coniochaeta sp. 2T2.1]|nr:hypothetical protein GE09DRAFT_1214455 [Coniochaeta sp. 2T2.1]